jgi:hypothetical protein
MIVRPNLRRGSLVAASAAEACFLARRYCARVRQRGVRHAPPGQLLRRDSGRFPFDGSLLEWRWPARLPVGALPSGWER